MKKRLNPTAGHLVVKRDESPATTKGGLALPDSSKEKLNRGEVLAVGPGKYSERLQREIPMQIEKGQVVVFGKYGGNEIEIEGEKYVILAENDILATLE